MRYFRIGAVILILLASTLALSACTLKPPVEDFAWVLTTYGQPGKLQSALATPEVTAYFSSKDNTLKGSTGPNNYSGTFKLDGMSLTISNIASTLVGSTSPAISAQESAYLRSCKQRTGTRWTTAASLSTAEITSLFTNSEIRR